MRCAAEQGISLVEATIVVTAVAILAAVAAPSASRALDRARIARGVSDAEAIKTAIVNFRADVFQGFTEDGLSSGHVVEVLVSDGDIPAAGIADDNGSVAGTLMRWDEPVADNDTADNQGANITTDFFERHLVTNNPRGSSLNDYPSSGGNQWRGAYINAPIDADPWGNRYAFNSMYLINPSNTKNDTFVLSAGPDEELDTLFEVNGLTPGDDDIVVQVLRDRNSSVP